MHLLGIFTFVLSIPKHPSTSRCIKPLQQIDLLSTSLITLPTGMSTSSPLKAIIPHILHWLTRFLAINTLHHICLILQNDLSTVSTSHTVQHMSKYNKNNQLPKPNPKDGTPATNRKFTTSTPSWTLRPTFTCCLSWQPYYSYSRAASANMTRLLNPGWLIKANKTINTSCIQI